MSRVLLTKIDAVRRKQVLVTSVCAIAGVISALIVLLAVGMLLDWVFDFPRIVRALLLAVDLCIGGYIIGRFMVLPIVHGPDDDELALLVEEAEPQFGHRLIGAIQLSRPNAVPAGASLSLVRTMIEQAESLAGTFDFARVIRIDRLMRLVGTAALIVLLSASLYVYGDSNSVSSDLLKRAFLSDIPVPRKTHVEVLSGDIKVARGDTVELSARSHGVRPSNGTVFVTTDTGRKQEFTLDPTEKDNSVFNCKIGEVQESFSYTIKLNDGYGETHTVKALIRPVVAELKVQEIFPAYTQQKPVWLEAGNLSILNGSRLVLKITANHKLSPVPAANGAINSIHLIGSIVVPTTQPGADGSRTSIRETALSDVPLKINSANPAELTAELTLPPRTSGFSINLVDGDGLQSKDPVVYRIDMVPDKDPVVKVTYPERKEELATKDATMNIRFDAVDDFGLSKITLKYKVDDGDVTSLPITLPPNIRAFRSQYDWDLTKVTVPPTTTRPSLEGGTIEYWVEAEDNNNVSGPGKGSSEHYSIKIVSEDEKRQELLQRVKEQVDGLQEGVNNQQHVLDGTGQILGKQPPKAP